MKTLGVFVGCALLATAFPTIAGAVDKSPQAQLDRALEGRIAGDPVDCITLRHIRSSRIIDKTAIIYEGYGDTIYVNYPESGAESLNDLDIQVTERRNSRLCSIDTVQLYGNRLQLRTGVIFLGKFVPYRKSAAEID